MQRMDKQPFVFAVLILLGVYFAVAGLVQAKGFLMPIVVAGLLSMLLLPIAGWLERLGAGRFVAALVAVFVLLVVGVSFIFLISWQITSFSKDAPDILDNVQSKIERLERFISQKTGISPYQQEQTLALFLRKRIKDSASQALGFLRHIPNLMTTALLVTVYSFFFIVYRKRFETFLLKTAAEDDRRRVKEIVASASRVAQQYLVGRLILVGFLGLIYGIGFSALGLEHAVFIAGVIAVFSLIPYLGNVIGVLMALAMGLLTGMGGGGLLGILAIFAAAQFIESYILQPYVVGERVELNAVMTVIAVVLGGVMWGIAGVIVAIPVVGIVKVVCDRVPQLNPFGYLLGEEDGGSEGWFERIKEWFQPGSGR